MKALASNNNYGNVNTTMTDKLICFTLDLIGLCMNWTKRVGPHAPQAIIAIIRSSALPTAIAELESRPLVKKCLGLHSVKRKSIYFQHLAIAADDYESSLGTDRLTSLL